MHGEIENLPVQERRHFTVCQDNTITLTAIVVRNVT